MMMSGVGDYVASRQVPKVRGRNTPDSVYYLSDTDIVRASERQHSVKRGCCNGDLGCLGLRGTRSKRIADYALVSADRRLDLGPKIVAADFLPRHAAPFRSHPQVTVALCRGGLGRGTHNRARPWRFCCRFSPRVGPGRGALMAKPRQAAQVRRDQSFKGRQFTAEVILWAVRWYLTFPISYRDLELMLLDRGVEVDHTTIFRWIQAYAG